MSYDQERIKDRINIARVKMESQVAADSIRGELCNWIRETTDPETAAAVRGIAATHPQVYKYIRRLEIINNGVYCLKCDNIKHVPGFHEQSPSPQSVETIKKLHENSVRKIESLLIMVRQAYEQFQENKQEINEYMKNLVSDIAAFKDTVDNLAPNDSSVSSGSLAPNISLAPNAAQVPKPAWTNTPRTTPEANTEHDWFKRTFVEYDDGMM